MRRTYFRLIDVEDDYPGFEGQELERTQQLLLFAGRLQAGQRPVGFKPFFAAHQQRQLLFVLLPSGNRLLQCRLESANAMLDSFQVRQLELCLELGEVPGRINGPEGMGRPPALEAGKHQHQAVGIVEEPQEPAAAFPGLVGAQRKSGKVEELNHSRGQLPGLAELTQEVQADIRYGDVVQVGLA